MAAAIVQIAAMLIAVGLGAAAVEHLPVDRTMRHYISFSFYAAGAAFLVWRFLI
jgi:hypothetical protein